MGTNGLKSHKGSAYKLHKVSFFYLRVIQNLSGEVNGFSVEWSFISSWWRKYVKEKLKLHEQLRDIVSVILCMAYHDIAVVFVCHSLSAYAKCCEKLTFLTPW